nr:AAA family ATPase [uncultured Shimia sp.]
MSFVNLEKVAISKRLKAPHLDLPRAEVLRKAFQRCVEEYYLQQEVSDLEVRGLVMTGQSRVGKTRELNKLIKDFNASETLMPDGRPAKVVSCLLSGRVTYKDLGLRTLSALGYELHSNRTQDYIWGRVLDQAQGQGVIGIHYDECQHVFSDGAKSNRIFLDSFKSLMKESRWPLMMILSGVPSLTEYVGSYEQLQKLVNPVHFDTINLKRDEEQLRQLLFLYADQVEVDIEELVTKEFLARLIHACCHRWGLVIELLIEALIEAKLRGNIQLQVQDFAEQFALKTGISKEYTPFTAPDFTTAFDLQKMFELYE